LEDLAEIIRGGQTGLDSWHIDCGGGEKGRNFTYDDV
jgi:hypothetical protein